MPQTPAWSPLTTTSNINYAQIFFKFNLPYTTKTRNLELKKLRYLNN